MKEEVEKGLKRATVGATSGAIFGTFLMPGPGTAVGAAAGALIGLTPQAWDALWAGLGLTGRLTGRAARAAYGAHKAKQEREAAEECRRQQAERIANLPKPLTREELLLQAAERHRALIASLEAAG